MIFVHCGAHVIGQHDGGWGYDWTATLGGVLIAKGWIRGSSVDCADAVMALLNALNFEHHTSKGKAS